MVRIRLLVTLFAMSAVRSLAQAPAPGTYRIWLCEAVCAPADSARAIAAAFLVVLDSARSQTDSSRAAFAGLRSIRRTNESAPVDNVCFRVTRRERSVAGEELYFGIVDRATTRWHYTPGVGFSVRVYQSPDAGYTLQWEDVGPLTRGEGWSVGWRVNQPSHRNAFFAAVSLGPPDAARCK